MEYSAPPIWLNKHVKDSRITVEDYTYFDRHISLEVFTANDRIKIGKFCSLAKDVVIFGGGNHQMKRATTFPFKWLSEDATQEERHSDAENKTSTTIGNDVWIGYGATVMAGVTVGNGAIIGARSVVTKDISPYAIVAGNPAKSIRYRFRADTIERLLQLAWWEWSPAKIAANLELLYANPDDWPQDLVIRPPQSDTLDLIGMS